MELIAIIIIVCIIGAFSKKGKVKAKKKETETKSVFSFPKTYTEWVKWDMFWSDD